MDFSIHKEVREFLVSLRGFCEIQPVKFNELKSGINILDTYFSHFGKITNSLFYIGKGPVPYDPISMLDRFKDKIAFSYLSGGLGPIIFVLQFGKTFHVTLAVSPVLDGKFSPNSSIDCYYTDVLEFLKFLDDNKDLEIKEVKVNKIGLF